MLFKCRTFKVKLKAAWSVRLKYLLKLAKIGQYFILRSHNHWQLSSWEEICSTVSISKTLILKSIYLEYVSSLFRDAFSLTQTIYHQMNGWYVNDELERMWKWFWPNLWYYLSICLEELRRSTKNLVRRDWEEPWKTQDSRSPGRD
jgi:hypothetical protein